MYNFQAIVSALHPFTPKPVTKECMSPATFIPLAIHELFLLFFIFFYFKNIFY